MSEGASTGVSGRKLHRWQWVLANGATIDAVIDVGAMTESVSQGSKVLSECIRGGKPDGHTIMATPDREPGTSDRPPIEAIVTFDPALRPICILRVDDSEVAPANWPAKEKPPPVVPDDPSGSRPLGAWILGGIGIAVLLVIGILLLMRNDDAGGVGAQPPTKLDGTHRAANGLFVTHYPLDFETRAAVVPPPLNGIILEDKERTRTIVFVAMPLDASSPRDPWTLQQRFHDEMLVNVPKRDGKYEESSRRDDSCHGSDDRGAVIVGSITPQKKDDGPRARVWSCAFVYKNAAYITMYMLAESAQPRKNALDERRLRTVLDAIELTQLADLGTAAPTDPNPLRVPSATPSH